MEGLSIGSLVLIIILAILLFGSKRLRSLGEDVGEAVKGFRKGMNHVDEAKKDIQNSDNIKAEKVGKTKKESSDSDVKNK